MLREAGRVTCALLQRSGRRRLAGLFAVMLGLALLEAAGVGSILPFVALLVDPGIADRSPLILDLRTFAGVESRASFIALVGVGVTVIVALVNLMNVVLVVMVQRFTWGEGADLAERLFRGWLAWPWVRQAGLHSAEVTRLLFTEVGRTVGSVLIPLFTLVARALAVVAIALSLVLIDPATTALTLAVLGGAYAVIFTLVRRRLAIASEEAVAARSQAYQAAIETFGGLKDVRIYGIEESVTRRFGEAIRRNGRAEARAQIAAQVPRYALETAAFGGLAAVAVAQLAFTESSAAAISFVATFAYAGYRIMPALQQTYAAAALVRANLVPAAELAAVAREIVRPEEAQTEQATQSGGCGASPEIRLERVSFRFPGAAAPVLRDVSLTIPPKSFVLVVGDTGSGKTTLIDLVAGLLVPSSGRILVDGAPLAESEIPAWRARLGYVAQTPMIVDDTMAANVRFGAPDENGEPTEKVWQALAGAHLEASARALPNGIETRVGERGARLSGGQRQRLAIARALYRRADVLILDESTSALDEETERAVLETLAVLRGRMTILMISHRPSGHADADLVIRVAAGTAAVEGAAAPTTQRRQAVAGR